MSTVLVRSARELKKLQRTAREALRAVRELERLAVADLFGRFEIASDEVLDEELEGELLDLLRLARQEYPKQRIEVIVVAHTGPGQEESPDGDEEAGLQR